MPELPEVETTCRGIEPHLIGQTVAGVIVRQPQLRYLIDPKLHKRLTGQCIKGVSRRAKYILIHLERDGLLIHLGMSGSLRVITDDTSDTRLKKHDHVDWVLNNGHILRYHDPRRFGLILCDPDIEAHKLLSCLGPEPLDDAFDGAYLKTVAAGRKRAIKPFIMDQAVVVGVGNIYAAEALFKSGIHPKRLVSAISQARYNELAVNIKAILRNAIEQGGTTLKDFVNGDGQPGYFQQQLFVYGRSGQSCHVCDTALKDMVLGQRATVYCPSCQT
ncbi:MAG: bifunctional DNA-formamidopyrimidine glycosylase/DNA-(apurinic or apyrimidinic site) lyase [Pseudomonadota bacterium]